MIADQDSFQEYKQYLQQYIHDATENVIKPPKQPFNAYMHFVLDKSSLERLKNPFIDWNELTIKLSNEWRGIKESERQFYEDAYQKRIKEREKVMKEYYKVSNTKKIPTPYIRFFKKLHPIYLKKYKPTEVATVIIDEWKLMDQAKKDEYIKEYEDDKAAQESKKITEQDKEEYLLAKNKYEKAMTDEKNKISRKNEVSKSMAAAKLVKREKAKIQRELDKKKKKEIVKEEDSDSEKVEDLVKKVTELKRKRLAASAKKADPPADVASEPEDEVVVKQETSKSPKKGKGRKAVLKSKVMEVEEPKSKSKPKGKGKAIPASAAKQIKSKGRRSVSKSPKTTKMIVQSSPPKTTAPQSRNLRRLVPPAPTPTPVKIQNSPLPKSASKSKPVVKARKTTKVTKTKNAAKPAKVVAKVTAKKAVIKKAAKNPKKAAKAKEDAPVVKGRATNKSAPTKAPKTKKIQKARPAAKVVKVVEVVKAVKATKIVVKPVASTRKGRK